MWLKHYYSVYKQYLKFLYASLDKKQTSSNQWPPSATKKYFRFSMTKSTEIHRGYIDDFFVRMTITGKVDKNEKYPIQLEDLFKKTKGKRKVILFEGACSRMWQEHLLWRYHGRVHEFCFGSTLH